MKRLIDQTLQQWRSDSYRKPLIIRGARQVGKTTAVRELGKQFAHYVELNLENQTKLQEFFEGDLDPKTLLLNLSLATGEKVVPGETLLFIDEIQACPRAIIALRYFYEKMPELHVIAAGSLLDFAIDQVGIPVGRVAFLYMYPLSFIEFLWALGETMLANAILQQVFPQPFNDVIHNKALRLFGEYIAIGGMPEAVNMWRETHDYQATLRVHYDLLSAYQQDFEKYAKKNEIKYLNVLFQQIPQQVGKRFVYANIDNHYRKRELEPAVQLLEKAKVVSKIRHTLAGGVPLGAEASFDTYKLIMVDVALTQAILGQTAENWILHPQEQFINKGNIAEAFVGQELLAYSLPRLDSHLYYWQRAARTSQAEIDYVTVKGQQIIPIEVKAGKGSTLKSLQLFLLEHPHVPFGIRFSTQNYSQYDKIHSYPLYAVAGALQFAP